jgi:hypothetical protein
MCGCVSVCNICVLYTECSLILYMLQDLIPEMFPIRNVIYIYIGVLYYSQYLQSYGCLTLKNVLLTPIICFLEQVLVLYSSGYDKCLELPPTA